jgi:hypothetical protein
VDYFRHEAAIMIATEAAAEGINLQFCNLIVNYDLPWNPQRIEQRIGRCHRYGQKFDVVVVNFLNRKNAADQRVYQLLDEKFRLFDGVFGASDQVLGAIESGVDFEQRIASIYQKCRTSEQIKEQFDTLQKELEEVINTTKQIAREELLSNFDQEVIEKVKIESANYLGKVQERLWNLTKYALNGYAEFNDKEMSFTLIRNPYPEAEILTGLYRMGTRTEEANVYRLGFPLAQKVLEQAKQQVTPYTKLVFDITGGSRIVSTLKPLTGKSGWLRCIKQTVMSFEIEDHLLFAGVMEDGTPIDAAQISRLFDLAATPDTATELPLNVVGHLESAAQHQFAALLADVSERNGHWFGAEIEKLDRWAEDRRTSLKENLKELDEQLKGTKKLIRQAGSLPDKLELQKATRKLEQKRDEAWREYDNAAKEIEKQKDRLIDQVEARLQQEVTSQELFTIQFTLI